MSRKKKAGCKEVAPVLKELFYNGASFRSQDEIKEELKENGIEASQITISRALQELGVKRNEVGEWTMDSNDDKLQKLKDIFQYAGSNIRFPRMYSNVDVVIVRTMPGYSNIIAEQIEDIFANEVLCTICPDNKNVIIYYKLKKKKAEHDEEDEKFSCEENIYKKSRMRQELVKICQSIRQEAKDKQKAEEQQTLLQNADDANITTWFFHIFRTANRQNLAVVKKGLLMGQKWVELKFITTDYYKYFLKKGLKG